MRTFDFAPLYRSTIGFDHLGSLLDSISQREQNQPSYPPYNIELLEQDRYRITMAVAGFTRADLDIVSEKQTLTVRGSKAGDDSDDRQYLYRGIATRDFERSFELAEHVKVVEARMENGLLHIDLVREVPEAMKPRQIRINADDEDRLIDGETEKTGTSGKNEAKAAQKVEHKQAS